jgi:GT2 family glycosyltransferase
MIRRISVVIVSDCSRPVLDRCLGSLREAGDRVSLEVLVVEPASRSEQAAWLAEQYPDVQRIADAADRGFAAALNQGLARAGGDYLLLLSPGCLVGAEALEYLMRALQRRPRAGAAAPMLLDADHRIERSCGRFPDFWTLLCEHLGWARRFPDSRLFGRSHYGGQSPGCLDQVEWASAAALLLSRSAYQKVGGLDDNLFGCLEEVDWCRRAARSGFAAYYVPQARLIRSDTESLPEAPRETYMQQLRSRVSYFRKHHGVAAAWAAKVILMASLMLECVGSAVRSAERPASRTFAAGLEAVWQA